MLPAKRLHLSVNGVRGYLKPWLSCFRKPWFERSAILLVLASQKLTSFVLTALKLRFQVAFAIQLHSIEETL